MIGFTLGRYFFVRYLVTVGYFLAGIMAMVFVTNFTQINDRLSGVARYRISTGLSIAALQVPMILQQTIPFVGLFASMALLVQLNRKYELVIARSAGLSAWQFLLPMCLGALAFGAAAMVIINPLAARTYLMAEEMQAPFGSRKAGASTALSIPWLRQKDDDGEIIIGAKTVLKDGTVLAAIRTSQAGYLKVARSTDGGRHWSSSVQVTKDLEHPADLIQLRDGRVLSHFFLDQRWVVLHRLVCRQHIVVRRNNPDHRHRLRHHFELVGTRQRSVSVRLIGGAQATA